MDTRPIKWHPDTLKSLLESDDSFEVPAPAKRTPIKPHAPKPKPNKNPQPPVKPTARQLTLQQKKQAQENLNSSKQTTRIQKKKMQVKVKTNKTRKIQIVLKKSPQTTKYHLQVLPKTLLQKIQGQSSADPEIRVVPT